MSNKQRAASRWLKKLESSFWVQYWETRSEKLSWNKSLTSHSSKIVYVIASLSISFELTKIQRRHSLKYIKYWVMGISGVHVKLIKYIIESMFSFVFSDKNCFVQFSFELKALLQRKLFQFVGMSWINTMSTYF